MARSTQRVRGMSPLAWSSWWSRSVLILMGSGVLGMLLCGLGVFGGELVELSGDEEHSFLCL